MRHFALTTISSFVLSASALCTAHAAATAPTVSSDTASIVAARENQTNDRRGKANDAKTGAIASEQLSAREAERNDRRGKGQDGRTGAIASDVSVA